MATQARPRAAGQRPWRFETERRLPTGSDASVVLAAGSITAIILVGMAVDSRILATSVAFGALLVAIVSPAVGLGILAFMATLQPPPGVPAPGFPTLLVGATLLGCIYRLPFDRPRPRANAALLALSAFVLYVTVQQLPAMASGYAGLQAHAVGYLFFQLVTGFGLVVTAIWVLSDRSPYPVMTMGLAGAATAALIALVPYALPAISGPFVNLSGHSADLTRASGPFSNPNFMGASAAMALAGAAALLLTVRSDRARSLLLIVSLLVGGAVLVSLSRGALIASVAGLAWLAISRSRASAVIVAIVGLVGALVVYPAFVEWRLVNLTGSASAAAFELMARSDEGRLAGVLAGLPLFLSSPIVGVGFGQYLAASVEVFGGQAVVGAHNWYVYVLAEQGVVGITLWLIVLAAVVAELRNRPTAPRRVGFAVFSSLAVASLFLEAPTSFQTVALPSLFLVAALAGDWGPPRDTEDGAGTLSAAKVEPRLSITP